MGITTNYEGVNKRCLSGVDSIGLCLGNIIWRFVIEYKNINLIMKLKVTLRRQFYYEDSQITAESSRYLQLLRRYIPLWITHVSSKGVGGQHKRSTSYNDGKLKDRKYH